MTTAALYAVFKVNRITSLLQHLFIIVRFQESRMALFEIMNELITGLADIGKNTNICFGCADYKTMGITGIMFFLECRNAQVTDHYGLLGRKMKNKLPDFSKSGFL